MCLLYTFIMTLSSHNKFIFYNHLIAKCEIESHMQMKYYSQYIVHHNMAYITAIAMHTDSSYPIEYWHITI